MFTTEETKDDFNSTILISNDSCTSYIERNNECASDCYGCY
jgi:hypothetical protein